MDKEFSNIRIVDIAKMAGVSVGTVDRVIHNRGRVSEENRKKVQAILEMVHYQPNLMAQLRENVKMINRNTTLLTDSLNYDRLYIPAVTGRRAWAASMIWTTQRMPRPGGPRLATP